MDFERLFLVFVCHVDSLDRAIGIVVGGGKAGCAESAVP
jgi:hypothetical protein